MKTLTMLLKLRTRSVVVATIILVFAYSPTVRAQVPDLIGGPLALHEFRLPKRR